MLKTSDGYKVGYYEWVLVVRFWFGKDIYVTNWMQARTALKYGYDFYYTEEAALAEAKRLNQL